MQAVQTLPPEYTRHRKLNLSTPLGVIAMNIVSIPLFILFGAFFNWIAERLQPGYALSAVLDFSSSSILLLLGLLATLVGLLIVHELIHGLFFWVFTRSRPKFAFKGLYAYAAAPGWYLSRNQHLVVGLAPFVLISLAGILSFTFLPPEGILLALACISYNAAGAVGDLLVAAWELFHSPRAYICDSGDSFSLHEPAA